jgi:Arginyl tRNA synthetase N terminal domain
MGLKLLSLNILYPTLRLLLVNRLQKTINLLGNTLRETQEISCSQEACSPLPEFFWSEVIPLSRAKDIAQIRYASPIALQLAKRWKIPPIELAEQIVTNLSATSKTSNEPLGHLPLGRSCQYIVIEITSPGWIHLELTDSGIADWLELLTSLQPALAQGGRSSRKKAVNSDFGCQNDSNFFIDSGDLFEIQYTHARCCAVLRLGEQEGLLPSLSTRIAGESTLKHQTFTFPWLTTGAVLRFCHPVERQLIGQIFLLLDDLADQAVIDRLALIKRTALLSLQIQAFHAACPILTTKALDLPLVEARLGLTLIAQILLRCILQDGLGMAAPIAL